MAQQTEAVWTELTYDERATYGTCPVCKKGPSQWCDGSMGLSFGGQMPEHGVHLGRLQAAPKEKSTVYR